MNSLYSVEAVSRTVCISHAMWQMRIMKQCCLSHRAAGRIFCLARHTEVKAEACSLPFRAKSSCILYKDNESEQTVTEDCSISYGEAQDLMEEEQSAVYASTNFCKAVKGSRGSSGGRAWK